MTKQYPAAFINVIHESGSKEEAVQHLQQTWNELCEAKELLGEAALQIEYLHEKFGSTGSGEAVLAKIKAFKP